MSPVEHESLLWYKAPAKTWTEALPVGNGRIGAMIFGGIAQERLQLNEDSLWSGRPEDADNPAALAALPEIRKLLFEGKYAEAQRIADRTLICKGTGSVRGKGAKGAYGSYQTLGDLQLDFDHAGDVDADTYRRELNLSQASARVSYSIKGVRYDREVFASYPDQVLVVRLTASERGALGFKVRLGRAEASTILADGTQGLLMRGQLWNGTAQEGMKYAVRLGVTAAGAKVEATPEGLHVQGATEALLLITAATDYAMRLPDWRQGVPEAKTSQQLAAATRQSFLQLRTGHLLDYRKVYRRSVLNLGSSGTEKRPTDERLAAVKAGAFDPGLTALYFHYGRYLLLASSRRGDMPANLQGIWADGIQNPWNADYHANINLQMIYWPAETASLTDCFEPLDRYVAFLTGPGAKTAKVHYNARGWTVHTLANVWGFTAPGESPSWGLSPSAGAWCAQHLWEHFAFSGDVEYLRRAFPILRGSAEFSLDWLVEDPKTGRLVAGPATSPENKFLTKDGQRGSLCMGPAMEQQLVWDAFTNYLEAARILGIAEPTVQEVEKARERLAPLKIGSDGRLMEWPEEFSEPEPGHRHVSHLFALHPGRQITRRGTPELFAAARKSLEKRLASGGGHTGWSRAWVINFWARLGEGDEAGEHMRLLLAKSTLPNLFDTHPPFQIDGNFGGVAGICEMLLQSEIKVGAATSGSVSAQPSSWTSDITLLPALPKRWSEGSVTGLRARGGCTVDLHWMDGHMTKAVLQFQRTGKVTIRYGGRETVVEGKAGQKLMFDANLKTIATPAS